MTELGRMLKDTLTTMERGLTDTQKAHGASLANQQRNLESHVQAIRQLQEKIRQFRAEQQESARHLQRLSDIHAKLEPLLSRLSALLNAK